MKNLRNFALAAFALLGFAACQQEEFAPEIKNPTHSVTFVAGAPETKTTANIEGNTVNYAWTTDDEGRFTAYENGNAATATVGILNVETGIMTLMATFEGSTAPKNASYVAVVNESNATQIMSAAAYDEEADILVSKAVSAFDGVNGVQLQFKREVAIAQMTLKGLDAGEVVNIVTVSSTADIAGSYGVDGWASPAASSIEISSTSAMGVGDYKIVANEAGEAVVWFTCIPQDAATLTVHVQAADGDAYTKEFSKPISLTRGNVKAFGVAMVKDIVVTPNETYNRITSQSELEEGEYVIGMALNSEPNTIKYLVNTTKTKPGCTDITGDITISQDGETINLNPTTITNAKWLVESVEGGFSISSMTENPAGLATTGANDGLTTQKTYLGNAWSITVNGETNACTMKYVPTSRYLNVYSLENPRTYESSTTNNNGKIYLYKRYDPRTSLTTPTNLAVSAEKVVSWDAVDGAASYVLTIGTDEYPCTSNSYDASAIEDEYYDVAVVAVPADTENYKNSAAATLTDAKFGKPTLATPTLEEGAVDEFSVNTTWTVDSRATSGYNCELYNGETKVGESKTVSAGSVTFDGLNDGVTYTVKVNAIAVEGAKAYAASAVETIDLTTTPASKVSDVTAKGTYTIKNLSVYAIPSKSVAILGDATGYILYYAKEGHGLSVGNTLNVAGPVEDYYGLWEFSGATASNVKTGSTPDYGEPVEATNEFLASFATKPLIKYIHAVGEQSGQDITVGENKLHLSAANSSTDGKTVTVYGFTYGYHSTKKYVQFVATSIAEDLTAPKLSVSPTSKTWASDETTAAVFNVTTNTEGEKDWSVSPTTLGWATVAVDKNAGTITVTPKDANTAETAREAKLTVTHSAGTLSETITLTQKGASTGGVVGPTDYVENFSKYSNSGNTNTAVIAEFAGDACKWSGVGATTAYYANTNNSDGTTGVTLLKPASGSSTYIISEKLQKGVSKLEITAHSNNTSASLKVYVVTSTEEKLLGEVKTTAKKTNFTESFVVDVTGEYQIKVVNDNTVAYINFTGLKWTSAN